MRRDRNYFYIPNVSETQSDCDEKPRIQVLFFQWRAPKEDREIDFTECVFHLNLFHCPSFGKAQNLSCVHARGGGSLNANYYMSLVRGGKL